jgi:hypothetical protein
MHTLILILFILFCKKTCATYGAGAFKIIIRRQYKNKLATLNIYFAANIRINVDILLFLSTRKA